LNTSKNHTMRFITRIEQGNFNTYWVRLGGATKYYIQKSFADNKHGGKRNALLAAKTFRDTKQKMLYTKYGVILSKFRKSKSKCVCLIHQEKNGTLYYFWRATFWDRVRKKQIKKSFSINKYGTLRAQRLAQQWHELKISGTLIEI